MTCIGNKLKLAGYATHQIGKWYVVVGSETCSLRLLITLPSDGATCFHRFTFADVWVSGTWEWQHPNTLHEAVATIVLLGTFTTTT